MAVSSRSLTSPVVGQLMKHRPFGVDELDRPIQQIQSRLVVGVVRYMQIYLAKQDEEKQQSASQIETRQNDVLQQLVNQLNDAIPDPHSHLTPSDLMQNNRWYSLEFSLFVTEYARLLSGDPDFYYNAGGYMIPRALVILTRPLSLRQVYLNLPTLMTWLVKTRIQVLSSTGSSVRVRWYPDLSAQRPDLRSLHIAASCDMWRGALAAVPRLRDAKAPMSKVDNVVCAKDGLTDYCDWDVRWSASPRREFSLGIVLISMIFAIGLIVFAGRNNLEIILFVLLVVTNVVGMLYTRSVRHALADNITQLSEQRDFAQQQYHSLTTATSDLNITNARLERRVNELTTLHQIGQTLSETAPVDQLIEKSFIALLQTLPYNGFIVMIANETTQHLSQAWAMKRPIYTLYPLNVSLPIKGESLAARIIQRNAPLLLEEVELTEIDAELAPFRMMSLVGIPLIHRRHSVGVLIAYYVAQRPLDVADGPLLTTIGAQMAAALDNAALYQTLEQRVQERTLDLQKATSQAQAAQRERSEFIARMNHELRTALQAILGFGEILLDDKTLTTTQHAQLLIIQEHAERLMGMIVTALQVSRLEAEKGILQPRRIDMTPFLTAITQDSIGRGTSLLKVHLEAVPPVLYTDPEKLRLVLLHLIRSLHERVPGSLLHLRLYYRGRLYIELWNEGDIVPESELLDIVRLFTRPYNSLTTHNTGMRLSITYQIVMLLGGILNVALHQSGGLVFRFDIPALQDADVPNISPETVVMPPPTAPQQVTTLDGWPAASLPGIMRDALRKAATRGDLTAMQQTLDVLAAQQPELASVIDEHVAQFEFDIILEWLETV